MAVALAAPCGMTVCQEKPTEPMDLGREEQVEVRLVLLDALVHDRKGRSVADLSADEFILFVDGKQVEIAAIDLRCPLGPAEGRSVGRGVAPPAQGGSRIVLAFDYYHMVSPVEAIERMKETIRERYIAGDELMVLSIGQTVRIEAPFTSDAAEILGTLDRMESDVDLYGGAYDRLTEFRFFERFDAVFDLLERIPGHKAVVLLSGPFEPDGFNHDVAYRKLAARAAAARVAVYPVDSSGLTASSFFQYGDFGGPRKLGRMAAVTGGRMTYNTNDLGLGLARAQRDLGCAYTIGFYDHLERVDKVRRIAVFVRRRGLRAIHPTAYVFRSDREKLKSFVATAHMMPEIFESSDMRIELVPLYPRGPGKWTALISTRIRSARDRPGAKAGEWKLEGLVRKPSGTVVRKWQRLIEPPEQEITVMKALGLKPGCYLLSVVLSDPGSDVPWASSAEVEIPEIPKNELFQIGPMLARRVPEKYADELPDLVPGQDRQIQRGEELTVMTRVCRVGADVTAEGMTVGRGLLASDGTRVWAPEPFPLAIEAEGKAGCQLVVDRLPTSSLEPGDYALESSILPGGEGSGKIGDRFTVVP
jgi:VWFA-related protein